MNKMTTGKFTRGEIVTGLRFRALGAAFACLALTAVVVGCGSSGSSSDGSSGGSGGKSEDLKIAFVAHSTASDPSFAPIFKGAEQAGEDLGVDVEIATSPQPATAGNVSHVVENVLATQPDGLIMTLVYPALTKQAKHAVEEGVPTIIYNQGLEDWESTGALTYVGIDNEQMGERLGTYFKEQGVSKVLCPSTQRGLSPSLDARCDGIASALGAGGEVLEAPINPGEPDAITGIVDAALEKNQDVEGVAVLGESVAAAEMKSYEDLGSRAEEMTWASFGCNEPIKENVLDGRIGYSENVGAFAEGYESVSAMVAWLRYHALLQPPQLTNTPIESKAQVNLQCE